PPGRRAGTAAQPDAPRALSLGGHLPMLGEALTAVNMEKDGILGCCMTFSLRVVAPTLAVLLLAARCIQSVPRYIVTPPKAQPDQQVTNRTFVASAQAQQQRGHTPSERFTEGASAALRIGGAGGAGVGAAAGAARGIVGTGASIGALAGGGTGAQVVGPS